MFQEGDDPARARAFQEIARLTGGAYGAFDAGAAARLATLLRAAAAYAAGGRAALEALGRAGGRRAAAAGADARLKALERRCRNSSPACSRSICPAAGRSAVRPDDAGRRPAKIVRGGGFALGVAGDACCCCCAAASGWWACWRALLFAGALRGGGNPFAALMGAAGWGGAEPRVSVARSATIEMRLDLDTGAMSGGVTAGPFAGRALER